MACVIPIERITAAAPALVAALGVDVVGAAEAIRTTDLRTKVAFREIDIGGKTVRFAAIAKGSGMIHPQIATMLCFIATDAAIAPETLQARARPAVEETFNTITVDGDMSTNDRVIALANGASGAPTIEPGSAALETLRAALTSLCGELARAIAADGEGATQAARRRRRRGARPGVARDLARAVAGGSLVKAGLFGGDPSWGRILAALGARIGARGLALDPAGVTLDVQGDPGLRRRRAGGVRQGRAVGAHAQAGDRRRGSTSGSARSRRARSAAISRFDYVKINAEYYGGRRPAAAPRRKRSPGGGQPPAARRGAVLHPQVRAASARSSSTAARRWSIRRSSAASPRRSCCCSRPGCSR